jgi:hypothetical protein
MAVLGLYINRPEPAIICTSCQYALSPSGEAVTKHLWEKHQIAPGVREGLMAYVRLLGLPDPNKLSLRDEGSPAHPHLSVRSGTACKHCDFKTTGLTLMVRHISKAHKGFKGGRNWMRDCIEEHVSLQSWTQNGARGYWTVDSDRAATPPAGLECSPRRQERVERMLGEEMRHLDRQDRQRSATDTGIDDLAATSNWMRRTGWAETYKGVDRRLLLALRRSPAVEGYALRLGVYGAQELHSSSDDERKLKALDRAVDRFFDRCEDTALHTDHSVRCWLRGQIPGRAYKSPFQLPGRKSTTTKYRAVWKSMLFYLLRTHRLDSETRRLHAPSKLSASLSKATERLWTACCSCTPGPTNHVVVNESTGKDADGCHVSRRCDIGEELHMPTIEIIHSLDNDSGPDQSSESEYELSSDDQTDCESQQSIDEPSMSQNPTVQVFIEC